MRIAVWYHGLLKGPRIPSESHAITILQKQMQELYDSHLEEASEEIHIGINGLDQDAITACAFLPAKSKLHVHRDGQSELATLRDLQGWLKPGWLVCYFHMKGVCYPNVPAWDRWRDCMMKAVIWNWQECVQKLEQGFDTIGAHWLTGEKYAMVPRGQRYWGGNFWWATSDYLLTLPRLTEDTHANRYEAEVWIGKGHHQPRVLDFAPHWPLSCPACL